MSRAGREIRAQAAIRNAPACSSCGHFHAHREKLATLYSIEEGVVVETPNPEYEPAVFYCTAEGCNCVIDRRNG